MLISNLFTIWLSIFYMTVLGETHLGLLILFWWVTRNWFPLAFRCPLGFNFASCSWPLLTDCWFCCRSSAGQRALWIDTSLWNRCWRDTPPPSSRKAWVQGASPTTKSNRPTHSLPQICSSTPPLPFFLCWLDFSLGHHEILVHVSNRADRLKGQKDCLNDWLTSSLSLDLCFFCFNYRGSWIFIGSEWHPIISCCKIGVNWINLMSLIKIPPKLMSGRI